VRTRKTKVAELRCPDRSLLSDEGSLGCSRSPTKKKGDANPEAAQEGRASHQGGTKAKQVVLRNEEDEKMK